MSKAIFQNQCNYDRHFDIDELAQHIENPTILGHVRAIPGDNLLCWRTEFFPQFPGSKGTEWHQVERFQYTTGTAQVQPHDGKPGDIPFELTVWTTLTEATIENGCMKFLPGSHPNITKNKTRFAFSSRYVSTNVMVYPNQEQFVEHGGTYDLEQYGVVDVSGDSAFEHNKVRNITNTGFRFSHGADEAAPFV